MPFPPTPVGEARSAPAQNALPAEHTTLARRFVSASASSSASASAFIRSTLTKLFGGRSISRIATWPSVLAETSPYWDFIAVLSPILSSRTSGAAAPIRDRQGNHRRQRTPVLPAIPDKRRALSGMTSGFGLHRRVPNRLRATTHLCTSVGPS